MATNFKHLFGEDAAQATVVIQARHDKEELVARYAMMEREARRVRDNIENVNPEYAFYKHTATLDNAASRIDRGDLVFQIGRGMMQRGTIMKNAIPVVSNLNGAYAKLKPWYFNRTLTEAEVNELLTNCIRYIGVSLGGTNPNPEDESSQKEQITVRVAGTIDVFNNCSVNFVPGDIVLWTVPSSSDLEKMKNRYGYSDNKVPLMIEPLRHSRNKYSFTPHVKHLISQGKETPLPEGMTNDRLSRISESLIKLIALPMILGAQEMQNKPENEIEAVIESILIKNSPGRSPFIDNARQAIDNLERGRLLDKYIRELYVGITELQDSLRARTVGTSMQYGKPGQKFTVLLGQG